MGQALDRYAAFKSTGGEVFYVYADITWDSSFYVRVSNIRYSSSESTYYFKWRVSPRNNTANPVAGTDLGPKYEFQGQKGGEYVLQGCTRESASPWGGTWETGGFTLTEETFQVTYDKNGYSWKSFPSNEQFTSGSQVTVQSATPPDSTSNTTNFTITGDANGGTFPSGATTKLNSTKTVKKSYNFDDWLNQDGFFYEAGSTFTIYGNTTLYAQQSNSDSTTYSNNNVSKLTTPNPPAATTAEYTVTFNPNGGSLETPTQIVNATITKTFSKWTSSSSGGSAITTLTSTGTVYAQWTSNYSNNTIILPLPTKKGYNFAGWSETSNGTNLLPAGSVVSITGNTTYYAIWGEQEIPLGRRIFIHDGTMWQSATGYIFNNETWTFSG